MTKLEKLVRDFCGQMGLDPDAEVLNPKLPKDMLPIRSSGMVKDTVPLWSTMMAPTADMVKDLTMLPKATLAKIMPTLPPSTRYKLTEEDVQRVWDQMSILLFDSLVDQTNV